MATATPEPLPHPIAPATPAPIDRGAPLDVQVILGRVRRVQEIMRELMKEGVHFGTIPGTQKPSLLKPGAELLNMAFRIGIEPVVQDLSDEDRARFRVRCRAYNQVTGETLGEAIGECSSDEEKYRWRKASEAEWAETAAERRRKKWFRGRNNSEYQQPQVRTSPADVSHTVLSMASKRSMIAVTRLVLACSDIFDQDLEDLSEELRESFVGEGQPAVPPPQRASHNGNGHASGVLIANVEKKSSQDGAKHWFVVKTTSGKQASTWSETLAKKCQTFKDQGTPIGEFKTEAGRDHRLKLVDVVPAAAAK